MISTDTNPEGKDVDIYGRENREMMSRLRPEARPRFSIGYLLFLTLILLALAGGATIFVARGGIDRIRSIWSDEKDFAELEAQMDQLRKWEETHDRISGLPYYILQFERLERRSPTVEELESAGLVSREQIVDGYGRMLVYDNINQEIVSFGPDRSRRTADDFVYSIEKSKFTAEPPKPELDSGELDEYTTFRK